MGQGVGQREELRIPTDPGDAIAATLYRPADVNAAVPCVVMGPGGTLTQRDGIPSYAERFAAAGIAALTFDYRHWGQSDGEPRRRLSIPSQLADWREAVARARQLDGVDPDRIVAWGMSLGGGHALITAAENLGIAAVIALVPLVDGLAFSRNIRAVRFTARALPDRLRRGSATLPMVGPAGVLPPEEMAGFERLAVPTGWRNEINTTLDYPFPLYRPVRQATRIAAPILIQLGEHDAVVSRRAVERTAARAPRAELRRYPIDHFGCFWPEHVDEVAGDQVEFLSRHL